MKYIQSLLTSLLISSFIFSQVDLSIENVTDNSLDIVMSNSVDVGGFQFGLDGVSITGASGGSATSNGFTLSTNSSLVLGLLISSSLKEITLSAPRTKRSGFLLLIFMYFN